MVPTVSDRTAVSTRGAAWLLFAVTALSYAYFFQGGGWNQNAHFDTVRALVERGTLEITAYASNTGDVSTIGSRVFSNKPPGLALVAAPFHFLATKIEQALGCDRRDPRVITANAHLVAFVVSGLPAALLIVALFLEFCDQGAPLGDATLLAAAGGWGTLLLPYAGLAMTHNLVALCLFVALLAVRRRAATRRHLVLAGALLAVASLADYLVWPLILALVVFLALSNPGERLHSLWLLPGPLLAGITLLALNRVTFGEFWVTSYSHQAETFTQHGLLFGVFDWPQLERLYWLTFHPFRGLFTICPALIVSLLAFGHPRRVAELVLKNRLALVVIAYLFLFNLSFNGWTGGWGIGPRYLIPVIPFILLFAWQGWQSAGRLGSVLLLASVGLMVAASAVRVMVPAPNSGPPVSGSAVFEDVRELMSGQISTSTQGVLDYGAAPPEAAAVHFWDSYNLGELLGLRGTASLLPLLGVIGGFVTVVQLRFARSAEKPDRKYASRSRRRQG